MSAPATHTQPSRKGKKAWRKNVDLDPVTSGLEAAREEYTQTGGRLLTEVDTSSLFQTDTIGDYDLHKQARKRGRVQLRADQILGARSNVPAVSSRIRPENLLSSAGVKRKRGDKISYAELDRLRALAYTSATRRQHLDDKPKDATHDPWAEAAVEVSEQDPNTTFLDARPPIREPKTLREAPISQTASGRPVPHVRRPDAGRSYNPEFRDWAALLEREGAKAVEDEKRRLAAIAADEVRQQRTEKAAAEVERQEKLAAGFSDYESEWEGFMSDGGAGGDAASLKAKRPERKTPMERKKVERRKKADQLMRHGERNRKRELQEKQMEAILLAAKAESKARALQEWEGFGSDMSEDEAGDHAELPRRPRFGKRFAAPDAPLELVLPDELQDSLRMLKPEGNLLKDRYRNAIVQGRVEARRPVQPHAARNRKATEKWSYKDWKLPSQM